MVVARNPTACAIMGCLSLVMFILALHIPWTDAYPAAGASGSSLARQSVSSSAFFDCASGFSTWQLSWTQEKKQWCCTHTGKACAAESFDCNSGDADWVHLWTEEKQRHCCDHFRKGCGGRGASVPPVPRAPSWFSTSYPPGVATTWIYLPVPVDHLPGSASTAARSSTEAALTDALPTRPPPAIGLPSFDCDAGLDNFGAGWSDQKREWCCVHEEKACVDVYDCDAGRQWLNLWSGEKKRYCCKHAQFGC